eukprot:3936244-Rhodomonas_salina.3
MRNNPRLGIVSHRTLNSNLHPTPPPNHPHSLISSQDHRPSSGTPRSPPQRHWSRQTARPCQPPPAPSEPTALKGSRQARNVARCPPILVLEQRVSAVGQQHLNRRDQVDCRCNAQCREPVACQAQDVHCGRALPLPPAVPSA